MHLGSCTYIKSRLCWRVCFCFSRLAHRKLRVLGKLGGRSLLSFSVEVTEDLGGSITTDVQVPTFTFSLFGT